MFFKLKQYTGFGIAPNKSNGKQKERKVTHFYVLFFSLIIDVKKNNDVIGEKKKTMTKNFEKKKQIN